MNQNHHQLTSFFKCRRTNHKFFPQVFTITTTTVATACTPGTKQNVSDGSCIECDFDEYQPESGQTECIPCPPSDPVAMQRGSTRQDQCGREQIIFEFTNGDTHFCSSCCTLHLVWSYCTPWENPSMLTTSRHHHRYVQKRVSAMKTAVRPRVSMSAGAMEPIFKH